MAEYQSFDLPLEIDEHELRYILPETFLPIASTRGWEASIEENVDGNHYMVLYEMSRLVPPEFDDADVADLRDRIGIIDEDNEIMECYDLWTESVKTWPARKNLIIDPPTSKSNRLFFEFEGFPTDETMDVMQRLMEAFPPGPKHARWLRLLGYFGLHKST